MKYIYNKIFTILTEDATLVNLIGYTSGKGNIRRGYSYGGDWDKLITFYYQPEYVITDFCADIKQIPLIVRVYDRDNDLTCYDAGSRIIELLDKADLSYGGQVHCYNCSYKEEIIATTWNGDVKAYDKGLRFMLTVRKI